MQNYFLEVDEAYQPTHRKWLDAKRRLQEAAVRLKEVDRGDQTEERTVDNPNYAELQQKIFGAEKALEKLYRRKLDANKKVSELYLLNRAAPELIAERKRLDGMRASAKQVHDEVARACREAERQLLRAMNGDYRGRLSVLEYAQVDMTDAEPESRGEDIDDLQARALACAIGAGAGVCPALLAMFLVRVFARRFYAAIHDPHRGSCAGCALVALICLLVPLAAAAGVVWWTNSHSRDEFERVAPSPRELPPERRQPKPETLEPVTVRSFQSGDIVYSQLDRNGFVTSISHFFRDLPPDPDDPRKPFTVTPTSEGVGVIEVYRLRSVGTGEVFKFENVAVKRLAPGDWIIRDEGQKQIRDQLQARMRVQLRRIRAR